MKFSISSFVSYNNPVGRTIVEALGINTLHLTGSEVKSLPEKMKKKERYVIYSHTGD